MRKLLLAVVASGLVLANANALAEGEASTSSGEKIFKSNCIQCHGSGASLQSAVSKLGPEGFSQVVLNGKGAMPAFSGNSSVSGQLGALYEYLSGGSDDAQPKETPQ